MSRPIGPPRRPETHVAQAQCHAKAFFKVTLQMSLQMQRARLDSIERQAQENRDGILTHVKTEREELARREAELTKAS